ncbi:MAG: restriction endonuclease [Hyphomicrobiales bacterium]|jgi:Holliday junction resolvase
MAKDDERLIQEVLAELGRDADPKVIADRVKRLDLGLPVEDEFIAVCSWLGKTRLIHKLDQHQAPPHSRDDYQIPDLLAQYQNTGPVLIEVKAKKAHTLSFKPDYLAKLQSYANLLNIPLLIAWKYRGIWTLFEAKHLTKARKNFNIRFFHALRENLLGVLAGDVAYKIATGAGVHFRFKKEKLIDTESTDDGFTEQWQMRVDKVGFTSAGAKPTETLDSEVTTLFTTWDLAERQAHSDTHVEMQFVATEDDGIMFSHTALVHLLNWSLPDGASINWRHTLRRDSVVSNMSHFTQALQRALEQKVVRIILNQQPQSWPEFLPK